MIHLTPVGLGLVLARASARTPEGPAQDQLPEGEGIRAVLLHASGVPGARLTPLLTEHQVPWAGVPTGRTGGHFEPSQAHFPWFRSFSAATTYLALEAGGDAELAAVWLDRLSLCLKDASVLLPAPPGLRVSHADTSLAVLSAPVGCMPEVPGLTPAEREVLEYLIAGRSGGDIAKLRGTAYSTVARQTASLFKKLNVRSRGEALALFQAKLKGDADPTPS